MSPACVRESSGTLLLCAFVACCEELRPAVGYKQLLFDGDYSLSNSVIVPAFKASDVDPLMIVEWCHPCGDHLAVCMCVDVRLCGSVSSKCT